MNFSRTALRFHGRMNPLYRERDDRIARGLRVTDLITGNVTENGLNYPTDLLRDIMSRATSATDVYKPNPLGRREAREAIAVLYRDAGIPVSPNRVILTPGTSVSYAYAFRLFADPGDEILCPRPSYPLFETIADFTGAKITTYRLDEDGGWGIDFHNLDSRITSRTRAIVIISPHNPTGAVGSDSEIRRLAEIARSRRLPILSDEVFGPFSAGGDATPRIASTGAPLVLTMNGFSKMFALPGIKIGWIAVSGDPDLVGATMESLETMSDMFLPVSEAAQFAVPEIIGAGKPFQERYIA